MAYDATPAAQPIADAPAPAEEAKAPPTIDSHGGKLTPITCFGCGPDGVTSLLMMLALLSTLAPRGLKAFGRTFDLSALRLAPGLLLTALLALNLLPSLEPAHDYPAKFHLVPLVAAAVGGALLVISFLRLLSEALMPITVPSRARAIAAMAASGLAVLALPPVVGIDVVGLMNNGEPLGFRWEPVLGGYLGVPAGLALLLAWRRFNGWRFDVLLAAGAVGLLFLGGAVLQDVTIAVILFLTVAFTVAANVGAGLRGMGAAKWQGLTGRVVWVLSWVLLIFTAMGAGMWFLF